MEISARTYKNVIAITSLCTFESLLIQSAWAKKKPLPIQLEASIGAQYDSNITVEEIDTSTTSSDVAALFDIDLDYKQSLSEKTKLNVSYSFSQSLHDDLDQFDIQTHLLTAGLGYDIDKKTSAGLNLNHADSALDGDGFLTLQQFSPFASHYFSQKLFVRSAFTYTDKSFDGRRSRDADSNAFNIDFYYFLDGPRHYLIGGYKYKDEEANTAQFDYDSYQLKLRWVNRLELFGTQSKLKLGWRFEQRDYADISSAAGRKRDDSRQRWSADFEIPLHKKAYLSLEYEYSDYDSNLDAVDYTQHMTRVRVGYKFF